MSIKELSDDFVSGNNTLITAPTGNGSSGLSLTIAKYLLDKDRSIIYYNSTGDIDREYVKTNFPRTYQDVFFFKQDLSTFLGFLDYINYEIDHIIIDPGDVLLVNKKLMPALKELLKDTTKLLVTSQIRQDPTKGGQVYSPLEELNKSKDCKLFDYSIWIRDVSEARSMGIISRYLDVYKNARVGNDFLRRYVLKFEEKTGAVII